MSSNNSSGMDEKNTCVLWKGIIWFEGFLTKLHPQHFWLLTAHLGSLISWICTSGTTFWIFSERVTSYVVLNFHLCFKSLLKYYNVISVWFSQIPALAKTDKQIVRLLSRITDSVLKATEQKKHKKWESHAFRAALKAVRIPGAFRIFANGTREIELYVLNLSL